MQEDMRKVNVWKIPVLLCAALCR